MHGKPDCRLLPDVSGSSYATCIARQSRNVRSQMNRTALLGFGLVTLVLLSTHCLGQWKPGEDVSGTRQVAGYSYGVGRLEWTFPAGLRAIFAVPHWTAGPRVKCVSEKPGQEIECEVEVLARNLQVSREERRRQLLKDIEPLLAEAKLKQQKGYDSEGRSLRRWA